MELALFGLGIILFAATWTFVWRPTVLDTTRDKLFDLRDEVVRPFFVERGLGLDHPSYIALRDLLNGHLRHTESLNFLGFVMYMASCDLHPKGAQVVRSRIVQGFESSDSEIQAFIKETRSKAALIMIEYMVESSLLVYFFALVILAGGYVRDAVGSMLRYGAAGARAETEFAQAFLSFWRLIGLAQPERAKHVMESCAYIKR